MRALEAPGSSLAAASAVFEYMAAAFLVTATDTTFRLCLLRQALGRNVKASLFDKLAHFVHAAIEADGVVVDHNHPTVVG